MGWRTLAGIASVGATLLGYQLLRPAVVETRHVPITTKIVFNREIAQIFQKKCFQCHTDGNVSVPLTTYKEARPWAVAIKEEILDRKMPPWGAAAGYGHFANDMSLTGREISLILSWADGGAPSGVLLVDEDKQPVYVPSLTGWEQGEPDLVVKVATNTKIASDAPFRVERYDVAATSKSAGWLRALQFDPSDRRAIRYAAIYDARNGRWLGTWTPSSKVSAMPAGAGVQLSAGAKLTVEIGYKGNPDAGEVPGSGDLGLYFHEKPPAQTAQSLEISSATAVNVPPGKTGERVRAETAIKSATSIAAIWPRLGPGARSIEVTAIKPDGVVEPMLWVNSYRAEWPTPYIMKEGVALPAGTRLVMTAYYDNPTTAAIAARPSVSITAAQPRSREDTTARPPR
ncbi:MAG TPA: cytochrome c [Vicinamibacterales bacterium]|nr:cytochrome c [Vicinamibacterales bacterium]